MTTLHDPPRPAPADRAPRPPRTAPAPARGTPPRGDRPGERAGSDFPHRPALDGFRGIALLCVLLFHGGVSWVAGGGLAVDAFFVLSGFLITGLLVSERARTHTIAFGAFWARRARRLLPALLVLLVGVAIYGFFFATGTQLARLRSDMFATVGYVANWRAAASGEGYLNQFVTPSPLMHMWSLAIEEQFYLLWPIIVWALLSWRARTRSWVRRLRLAATICAAAAAGTAIWMAYLYAPGNTGRLYYGTDTRAGALLLGATVAFWNAAHGPLRSAAARRGAQLAAWCFVALGLLAWSTVGHETPGLYRGGFLLASVGAAAVIFACIQPGSTPLQRVLAVAPARFLGKVSYGTYLWHWPIYLVVSPARTGLTGAPLLALRLTVAIAAGWLSFKFVEWPVRAGTMRTRQFVAAVPSVAAIAVVGTVLATTAAPKLISVPATNDAAQAAALPVPSETTDPEQLRLFLAGDSVLFSLGAGVDREQEQRGFASAGRPLIGCGLMREGQLDFGFELVTPLPECQTWPELWGASVDTYRPNAVILEVSLWDLQDRRIDGRTYRFLDGELDARYLVTLDAAVTTLSRTGAPVFLVTAPYSNREASALQPDHEWAENDPRRTDRLNDLAREYARTRPGVTLVDLNRYLAPDGRFTNAAGGVSPIFGDGVHFSVAGAEYAADWVLDQVEQGRAASSPSPAN